MTTRRLSTGSEFEDRFGYSRAIVRGAWCFVSGVTGYDYASMRLPDGAAEQAQRAVSTIDSVLSNAGFAREDIVRVQYTLPDRRHAAEVAPVLRAFFRDAPPAATMVIAGLIEPEMLIEIEVTAYRG